MWYKDTPKKAIEVDRSSSKTWQKMLCYACMYTCSTVQAMGGFPTLRIFASSFSREVDALYGYPTETCIFISHASSQAWSTAKKAVVAFVLCSTSFLRVSFRTISVQYPLPFPPLSSLFFRPPFSLSRLLSPYVLIASSPYPVCPFGPPYFTSLLLALPLVRLPINLPPPHARAQKSPI